MSESPAPSNPSNGCSNVHYYQIRKSSTEHPIAVWLPRARAVAASLVAVWGLGLGSVLSISRSAGWRKPAWVPWFPEPSFFHQLDFVSSDILLLAGALATSVLVGWRIDRKILDAELMDTTPGPPTAVFPLCSCLFFSGTPIAPIPPAACF